MQKRRILGIDPGIADTGYGIIEVNGLNLTCLDFGSIKTSPKDILSKRLADLYRAMNDIIDKYKPELVSVEKIFFNVNTKTALTVGQARGVILLSIEQNSLKMVEFTPLQLKQTVSLYGRAGKNQVKKMVQIMLKLEEVPKSDDAADALALAICALNDLKK